MNELFLKIINIKHIGKLARPGSAVAPVCFEESPQVGQCPALGHRSSAAGFPIFHRERIESNSKCRNHSAEHWNEYHPYHQ